MKMVVQAHFNIEKRLNPTLLSRTSLSEERERHYIDMIEKVEFEILTSLGFDLEFELPYKHLRHFCDKNVAYASRETMY
jgi:hypothetical protein